MATTFPVVSPCRLVSCLAAAWFGSLSCLSGCTTSASNPEGATRASNSEGATCRMCSNCAAAELACAADCCKAGTACADCVAGELCGHCVSAALQANQRALLVYGMSCPLCAQNIDLTIRRAMPAVQSVRIDLATGLVWVQLLPSAVLSPGQLSNAVRAAGFTPVAEFASTVTSPAPAHHQGGGA